LRPPKDNIELYTHIIKEKPIIEKLAEMQQIAIAVE
jgi:hypothetical protein